MNKSHTSPKDFFMNLLAIVTLYISAFSFGTILFQLINFNFPDELTYFYTSGFIGAIRWSIASLIVALPTYILTSLSLTKDYTKNPEKRNLRVRNWLIYLTLFIAAIIILVSLMSVIYQFLGGEITIRFILKVFTILYIAGIIFGYYIYKIKTEKESKKVLLGFIIETIIASLIVIILGFLFIGSPSTQRTREFDEQRLQDISNISSYIQDYYFQNKILPLQLSDIKTNYYNIPKDPKTNDNYTYKKLNNESYELCATFELDKFKPKGNFKTYNDNYIGNRNFTAGENCFNEKINSIQDKPFPIR